VDFSSKKILFLDSNLAVIPTGDVKKKVDNHTLFRRIMFLKIFVNRSLVSPGCSPRNTLGNNTKTSFRNALLANDANSSAEITTSGAALRFLIAKQRYQVDYGRRQISESRWLI
jgi:hypothetical protein